MIIEIKYRDKQNWVSLSQKEVKWTNYSKKYKNERVVPAFISPVEVQGTWNGIEHDVQHITWESYFFEMYIKESEIQDINRLKSCSDIIISEYNRNENGTFKVKEYIVDTSKSEYFDIQIEERISQTSAAKVSITFRINKTIVNKGTPVLNTNELKLSQTNFQKLSELNFISGANLVRAISETRIFVFNSGYLYCYDKSGSQWVLTGTGANTSLTYDIDFCILDANNIALTGDQKLEYWNFNGSTWSKTGNSLFYSNTKNQVSLTAFDLVTIALIDITDQKLECYEFDGSDWAQVGNSLAVTTTSPDILNISAHSNSDLAYIDTYNNELRNYSWDGTDFTLEHSTAYTNDSIMCSVSTTEIILIDTVNYTISKFANSGTDYAIYGNATAIDELNYTSISKVNSSEVLTSNYDNSTGVNVIIQTPITYSAVETKIAVMTSTRIAIIQNSGTYLNRIIAYDLIAGVWTRVGNEFLLGITGIAAITGMSSSTLALRLGGFNRVSIYSFNGTNWSLYGSHFTLTGTKPRIAYIAPNRVVTYDISDQNLRVLAHNGTIFAQEGNELNYPIATTSDFDLVALDDETVLFFDSLYKEVAIFNWDGTDFTLTFAEDASYLGGKTTFAGVDGNTFAAIDGENNKITYYDISLGSLTELYSLTFPYQGVTSDSDLLSTNRVISFFQTPKYLQVFERGNVNENITANYNQGSISYFTDFDLIENTIESDPVNVDWSDGTQKLIQNRQREVIELLFYFTTAQKVVFLEKLKSSPLITINDISILNYTIEQNLIGYDYNSIILRGVISDEFNTFDLSPNNTYNLKIVNNSITYNFYTDFVPFLVSEEPIINTFDNQTGINTPTKNISKTVKRLTFFENESDAFNLKKRFELGGTVTLNTVAVQENRTVTPEKIGHDLYKIEVDCLLSTDLSY